MSKNKIFTVLLFLILIFLVFRKHNEMDNEVKQLSLDESTTDTYGNLDDLEETVGLIDNYEANDISELKCDKNVGVFIPFFENTQKDNEAYSKARKSIKTIKESYGLYVIEQEKFPMEFLALTQLSSLSFQELSQATSLNLQTHYRRNGGIENLKKFYIDNLLGSEIVEHQSVSHFNFDNEELHDQSYDTERYLENDELSREPSNIYNAYDEETYNDYESYGDEVSE